MDLPLNVQTGLVTGRYIVDVVDGPDENLDPDAQPVRGQIVFTASVPYLPNPTAAPDPVTIMRAPIVGVLDADGYLCTPYAGTLEPLYRGVRLIATDDPDIAVTDWTWDVTYIFEPINGHKLAIPAHGFALPSDETVDLTKVAKVPSSPGYSLPQAEAAVLRAEAIAQSIRDDADAGLFNGEAATVEVGTVTSGTTAEVVNVGDEQHAILNITLEKGDKGDTGNGVPDAGEAFQLIRMDEIAGTTEWVTPSKELVGLAQVDNTSDMNKPVSTMQKLSLDEKIDAAKLPDEVDGVNKTLIDDPASLTAAALSAAIDGRSDLARTTARPVNLREAAPNIDWSGTVDAASDVQGVIDLAGPGARIELGRGGKLRLDTGLTMQDYQTIMGTTRQVNAGSTTPTELVFKSLSGSARGITMAHSCGLSNLMIRGQALGSQPNTVGVYSDSGSAILDTVQVAQWGIGVDWKTIWYGIAGKVESRWNGTGFRIENCYNLAIVDPQINGNNGKGMGTFGDGIILTGPGTMLNVHRGAIEGTSIGIKLVSASSLDLIGTYWETGAPNAKGIDASAIGEAIVNISGSQVYLSGYEDAWVDFRGSGNSTLNSGGNFFKSTQASAKTPTAYKYDPSLAASEVTLGISQRDTWRLMQLYVPDAKYTSQDGVVGTGISVAAPRGYTQIADVTSVRHGRSLQVPLGSVVTTGSGTTAARPAPGSVPRGSMWWDASLRKPIYSTGPGGLWVDAAGNNV